MAEGSEMKQVLDILTGMQGDIRELKTDVSELKADVAELKSDVAILKTDVAELKSDVSVLKADVSGLKTEMGEVKSTVADLSESMHFMQERMMTKEDGREMESRIMTHIDGLAKRSETFEHELVATRSRYERHERRIETLEAHAGIGGSHGTSFANDVPCSAAALNTCHPDTSLASDVSRR